MKDGDNSDGEGEPRRFMMKRTGAPHNYLEDRDVQVAWNAFKAKVKEAQATYEVVMGFREPTLSSQ